MCLSLVISSSLYSSFFLSFFCLPFSLSLSLSLYIFIYISFSFCFHFCLNHCFIFLFPCLSLSFLDFLYTFLTLFPSLRVFSFICTVYFFLSSSLPLPVSIFIHYISFSLFLNIFTCLFLSQYLSPPCLCLFLSLSLSPPCLCLFLSLPLSFSVSSCLCLYPPCLYLYPLPVSISLCL